MPKIKYVGVKEDGETAFSREPGAPAVWMPGDSFDVSEALAKKMLQHPDVFAADEAAAAAADTGSNTGPETSNEVVDEFTGLDKAALHALAKERGVEVHHNAKAETVAKALREAAAADTGSNKTDTAE